MWKKAALIVVGILVTLDFARAETYIELNVYYVDFSARLRSRMTVSDVRERYLVKMVIRDGKRIRSFISRLPFDELSEVASQNENPDIRLVVDAMTSSGKVETFYASQFFLYGKKGFVATELQASFVEKFNLIAVCP